MDDLNEYKICPFKPVTNFKKNKNVHSKYLTKTKTELLLILGLKLYFSS